MVMLGNCCCESCSKVQFILQNTDRSYDNEVLGARPWSSVSKATYVTDAAEPEKGGILQPNESVTYSIEMGCSNYGIKLSFADDGGSSYQRDLEGVRVKCGKYLQVHQKYPSYKDSDFTGTPDEFITIGATSWKNGYVIRAGHEQGFHENTVSTQGDQYELGHSPAFVFYETDRACGRSAGIMSNADNKTYYDSVQNLRARSKVPTVPSGSHVVELTITAGNYEVVIDEISFVSGSAIDLYQYHDDFVYPFDSFGMPYMRESIQTTWDNFNPVHELITTADGYWTNTGGCPDPRPEPYDTLMATGQYGVYDYELTSTFDNTQFSGSHVIELWFSQTYQSRVQTVQDIERWGASPVGSMADYNAIVDQQKDIENWVHTTEIKDWFGYMWLDKEMDETIEGFSFSATMDPQAGSGAVTVSGGVSADCDYNFGELKEYHTWPNKYLGRGPKYVDNITWFGPSVSFDGTCTPSSWSFDCDTEMLIQNVFAINTTIWRTAWSPYGTWDWLNTTGDSATDNLFVTTPVNGSLTWNEDVEFDSYPNMGTPSGYIIDDSSAGNSVDQTKPAVLSYNHTVTKLRSYERWDEVTYPDACPNAGNFGNTITYGTLQYDWMYLKEDALRGIVLTDTDSDTVLFTADKIYHDPSRYADYPSDAKKKVETGLTGLYDYTREDTSMFFMDGTGDFDGETWAIYKPFEDYAYPGAPDYTVFHWVITDLNGNDYRFNYWDYNNQSYSEKAKIPFSLEYSNYRLEGTYHR